MLWKAIAVSVLTFLLAGNAQAQGFAIGPQIGYHKSADAVDGKYLVGAALRLKLSNSLAVEGAINYRKEEFSDGTSGTVDVKSWPVTVTGMLYVLPIVYGAVGAGWYNNTFDFNTAGVDNVTEQDFGWHFGAGAELPLGNLILKGDLRYTFLDYSFGSVPFKDVDSNFFMVSGGVLFGL